MKREITWPRRLTGKAEIDLNIDPPPDLVVESDYTRYSLNKLEIYASLGVPEFWRYRLSTLQVDRLIAGKYEPSDRSLAFPFFPIAEAPEFIAQSQTIGQRMATRYRSREGYGSTFISPTPSINFTRVRSVK
ncbi:MAG: Uma2 family endonuclease [Hormoscilla sp. SP5CHS1]|nr:Uma2 family endonuclease [Hormoscilla sp. SP12CHS1]MBC6452572.1 Uma2 family endonuclease [Hormoscilla sp. SP5CHS1]